MGYYVYGDYLPLRRVGTTMVVTSTYPAGGGQTVTETDTIAVATHLPISTFVNVPAASGHPGYTEILRTAGSPPRHQSHKSERSAAERPTNQKTIASSCASRASLGRRVTVDS